MGYSELWVQVQWDGSTLTEPVASDDIWDPKYNFIIDGIGTYTSQYVYLDGTPLSFNEYAHLSEVQETFVRPSDADALTPISVNGYTATYHQWFSVLVPPGTTIPNQYLKNGTQTAPILGDPLDPSLSLQDRTTATAINDILAAYAAADPQVQAAVPSTVLNTIETIGNDASGNSTLITAQIEEDAAKVDTDVLAAQNANDASDPTVQQLETDTGTLLTDWAKPFVGPVVPPSSPPVGSQGDYGQNVPYYQPTVVNGQQVEDVPSTGRLSTTDEFGNPLPLGITRGLQVGSLSEATIADVAPGLKENFPTIEDAIHTWEAANGLPTSMTINAGTNGHANKPSSDHNIGSDGYGHAIDVQLPTSQVAGVTGSVTPLTPTQLEGLITTLLPLLPAGYRIGLSEPVLDANGKPTYKPSTDAKGNPITVPVTKQVPGAAFPDQTTSLHIDDGGVAKLKALQSVISTGRLPTATISPTTLQQPDTATFIPDDDGVFDPGMAVIDAVTALASDTLTGANGMTDLNAIFANAKLVSKAAFVMDAPTVDGAFATLVKTAAQAQATAVFTQNGLTGFAENGITPGAALISSLKNLIG